MTTDREGSQSRRSGPFWQALSRSAAARAVRAPAPEDATPSALRVAPTLVRVARLDTVYGDVYLDRARALLAPDIDEATYAALRRARAEAASLPDRIRNAIQLAAWHDVKDLSDRLSTLRRTLSDAEAVLATAREVYDFEGQLVDPFSPGLAGLAGTTEHDLPALRDEARDRLSALSELDPDWTDFYRARWGALAALDLSGNSALEEAGPPSRAEAERALDAGDLARLATVAERLASQPHAPSGGPEGAVALPDLTYGFPADALARASRLGLSPVRVESVRDRVTDLYRHAWRPTLEADEEAARGTLRIPVKFPPHTPMALQERLELYLDRPFVNSGGARNLPYLVREDALVELFDEPRPGAPPTPAPLLDALGLPARNGLSRSRIEHALRLRGHEVVRELHLDPREFRLVCIPCDLHVRIGEGRGWGTQPIWTHLDGWMVLPRRKFLALAGGDVRFGGIYDLVGVGDNYDSEHLFVRFAVVLRKRMAAW